MMDSAKSATGKFSTQDSYKDAPPVWERLEMIGDDIDEDLASGFDGLDGIECHRSPISKVIKTPAFQMEKRGIRIASRTSRTNLRWVRRPLGAKSTALLRLTGFGAPALPAPRSRCEALSLTRRVYLKVLPTDKPCGIFPKKTLAWGQKALCLKEHLKCSKPQDSVKALCSAALSHVQVLPKNE